MNGIADDATEVLKKLLNVGQSFNQTSKESPQSEKRSEVNILQQLFANAAHAGNPAALEQLIELRTYVEGESILCSGQDVRVDVRTDKAEYLTNKIKIKNVVDLGWENKFTYGNFIAEHPSGYLAYTLKTTSGAGGVRIINSRTNCRALIKGIQGQVSDIAFAHLKSDVILAVIDSLGNLYVYQIGEDGGISYFPLFQINRCLQAPGEPSRVIWCKYVPDDFEYVPQGSGQEPFSKLLFVSHANRCEFYYVDAIIAKHGQGVTLDEGDLHSGCDYVTQALNGSITEGSIAPEATTAAVCTSTGLTRFYKLNMTQDPEKRQLTSHHEWQPHQGPISSIFFLDDQQHLSSDSRFWEYVVTGANENRELKLWHCGSWTCKQTLRFDGISRDVSLKARMDASAQLIILSDLSNNHLYIVHFRKVVKGGSIVNVSFGSIAYFHVTFPVVSFTISSVTNCKYKPMEEHFHNMMDRGDDDDDTKLLEGLHIELSWLTTRSLQKCSIIFKPIKAEELLVDFPTPVSEPIALNDVYQNAGSESSSPSKEVADILQQTESDGNLDLTSSPEEAKTSPAELRRACEQLGTTATLVASASESLERGFAEISLKLDDMTKDIGAQMRGKLENEVQNSILPAVQTSFCKIGEDCKLAFLTEARQTARDSVNQVVCPTFERISQKLFSDLNSSVSIGFKQLLENVQLHLNEKAKERNELNKKFLESAVESAVGAVAKQMNKTFEQTMIQIVEKCRETITSSVSSEMTKYDKGIRTIVSEEIQKALQADRRSITASPASSLCSIESNKNASALRDIKWFLSRKEIKEAFSRALSVSDLEVLMQTLRMADRKSIFQRDRCPLTPQVLVALIQQLSADISTQTQLKLDYLEDAMMTLDAREDLTKQLLSRILPSFVESLKTFLAENPQHVDYRRIDRLRTMAEFFTDRLSSS